MFKPITRGFKKAWRWVGTKSRHGDSRYWYKRYANRRYRRAWAQTLRNGEEFPRHHPRPLCFWDIC